MIFIYVAMPTGAATEKTRLPSFFLTTKILYIIYRAASFPKRSDNRIETYSPDWSSMGRGSPQELQQG